MGKISACDRMRFETVFPKLSGERKMALYEAYRALNMVRMVRLHPERFSPNSHTFWTDRVAVFRKIAAGYSRDLDAKIRDRRVRDRWQEWEYRAQQPLQDWERDLIK